MKKRYLLPILGCSIIATSVALTGCGSDDSTGAIVNGIPTDVITTTPTEEPTETPTGTIDEVTPTPEIVEDEFNVKDYITEEIVDGKLVITAKSDVYAWDNYDDGIVEVVREDGEEVITLTITGTEAGNTAINLIGDSVDQRISYVIDIEVKEDLSISEEFVVDASIGELEEEVVVAQVDEDLKTLIDTTLTTFGEDNIPALDSRMIDMTNSDDMKYVVGVESIEGLQSIAASEPMMTSVAFSLVTMKFDTADNANAAIEVLNNNAPTQKWVCVVPDGVKVVTAKDVYVIMLMGPNNLISEFEAIKY